MKPCFDHEKLQLYQDSIKFVVWASRSLERFPKGLSVSDQLDRASTSIPLNIAEGNGKFTAPDRCRFFDNARGSAFECAACLDVLVAREMLVDTEVVTGKETLRSIVSMIVGLIRSNSSDRLHEDHVEYRAGNHETSNAPDLKANLKRSPLILSKIYFDHEKLRVYQTSLKFIGLSTGLLERLPRNLSTWDRLDRASTSIPLNIAEGNGKYTVSDRCRFFDSARGSALHCAACLDLLAAKGRIESAEISPGKEALQDVVSMLVGLIKSNSPARLHEQPVEYRTSGDCRRLRRKTD